MRNEVNDRGHKVVAISSQHTVTLAMRWPEQETREMLGFAVRRHNPDDTVLWLEGLLGFKGQQHEPGVRITTNQGPIQKMFWADYNIRPALEYSYEVIPVYGQPPDALELREQQAVTIKIETEDNAKHPDHQVYFNRAVIASQAYVHNFGLQPPDESPEALAWLARGLDQAILDFIGLAVNDRSLKLDVAAYHLVHPDIIAVLAKVGSRARVAVCWKKPDDQKQNQGAVRSLKKAKVEVFKRTKVGAISHDKFIVLKDKDDQPQAVLMGSTNFTVGGVSEQNNVSHIIRNQQLAQLYLDTFELLIAEDNQGLKEQDAAWMQADEKLEVNFSPHATGDRTDLDRFVELVTGAKSNTFFATFRATDEELLTALADPKNKNIVVRGLVDKVYESSPGEVALYHAAHQKDPNVVPATTMGPGTDPLTEELARVGFKPLVHHKFILIDYGQPNSAVITGSANYSNNSSQKNDENTLIVHRDKRVTEMYLGEFHRIYEHYRARWFINSQGKQKPQALYLAEDGSWAKKYYNGSESERFVRVLLGEDGA